MCWLYRRNNLGQPTRWRCRTSGDRIIVHYGIVGKNTRVEDFVSVQKDINKEVKSKYAAKRKEGYLSLDEIKDDGAFICSPVDERQDNATLLNYLNAYLPKYHNNNNTGALLPMLAKSYDGKFFDKVPVGLGQWKINGLRCFITAKRTEGDLFNRYKLIFQSREGEFWNTLHYLEDYLLHAIPEDLIDEMCDNGWALDGEVYLPGYKINAIDHFVKDATCQENKLLQFWCYDIAIDNMSQTLRDNTRNKYLFDYTKKFVDYQEHISNEDQLINLPSIEIVNNADAIAYRNDFISLGFEGLILRNPNSEYEYGRRRVKVMEKFKDVTDGVFEILAINKEQKRNLPIFTCRNDINDATFDCKINGSFHSQLEILANKEQYIGKKLYITFGERSGVNRVPFHLKKVVLHLE